MNFAFLVVVVAAITGLASQLALRAVAPGSGPALGLLLMSVGLIGTAWLQGRKREEAHEPEAALPKAASESLAPT